MAELTTQQQQEAALVSALEEETGGVSENGEETGSSTAPAPSPDPAVSTEPSTTRRRLVVEVGDDDYVFQDPAIQQEMEAALRRLRAVTTATVEHFRKKDKDAAEAARQEAETSERETIQSLVGHLTGVHSAVGSPAAPGRAAIPPPPPVDGTVSRRRAEQADAEAEAGEPPRPIQPRPAPKQPKKKGRVRLKERLAVAGEFFGIGPDNDDE